jgi:hypothetical protein
MFSKSKKPATDDPFTVVQQSDKQERSNCLKRPNRRKVEGSTKQALIFSQQ